jgi:hypothetical protein
MRNTQNDSVYFHDNIKMMHLFSKIINKERMRQEEFPHFRFGFFQISLSKLQ